MSLAAQITPTGIIAPGYSDILATLILSFKNIFGSDVYLGADSQDFQMLAVFAQAISDNNQMSVATYNSFSPATAQGAGLASIVKLNGLKKLSASNSTVDVTIVGQAGTQITAGVVQDTLGKKWNLPASVTIPFGGSIVVTATAVDLGDIPAAANTVTKIVTPFFGWQTVTNANPATLGAPIESDAKLRRRQSVSTALPALTVLDSTIAAIANLQGVQRYKGYENDTGATDSDGVPAHSIAIVVEGGDVQEIVDAIGKKKTPGTPTYGTTSGIFIDARGISKTINYFALAETVVTVEVDITALAGYVSSTGDLIIAAIVNYLNGLDIGEDVNLFRIGTPANLDNAPLSTTYKVTAIRIARGLGTPGTADLVMAFNEAAICAANNVTLTVS